METKRMSILFSIVTAVVMMFAVSNAALVDFNNGAGTLKYETGGNWSGGLAPNQTDSSVTGRVGYVGGDYNIVADRDMNNAKLTLYGSSTYTATNATQNTVRWGGNVAGNFISLRDSSKLTVSNATYATRGVLLGNAAGQTYSFNLYDSAVANGIAELYVGSIAGATGIVNQAGGHLYANSIDFTKVGSKGWYNLSAGDLNLGVGGIKYAAASFTNYTSYINFSAASMGSIIVTGNYQTAFIDRITNGIIRIDGLIKTASDYKLSYDGVKTTLQIPEPATIGMLGLGAIITVLIRRMRTC